MMNVIKSILSVLLLSVAFCFTARTTEKPNILVFIADDAGRDFGCYGNQVVNTPYIDNLAAEGLIFNNAFVTAPQCSPCRTSILSGKFAHTIGTEDLHVELDSSVTILPTYLKQAGYYTGMMLKGHIGEYGNKQFDYYDYGIPEYYGTGEYNDKMMGNYRTFLDEAGTKPFFLWMGFVDPHRPYVDTRRDKNHAMQVHDPSEVIVPPYLDDNDSTRLDLAHYYDEIYRMDSHIGLMLAELKRRGKLKNTLVLFFSDNGMPFPRAKMTCYDSGIKTPFVAWWPGKIKPGSVYDELVSMIDLSPTLLDVAGAEVPEDMYGKSFKRAFFDQTVPVREYIFAERNKHIFYEYARAVRTNQYKLIINKTTNDCLHCDEKNMTGIEMRKQFNLNNLNTKESRCFVVPEPSVELYNLQDDPFEFKNIADDDNMQEIKNELLSVLIDWQKETNDHPPKRNQ